MTDQMTHISARIPQELRQQLDEIARQRRMDTGDDVRLADLVRDALKEYVERHR